MTKKEKAILGKVVALTKAIYFKEPSEPATGHQFRPGDGITKGIFRTSGLYLEWWVTSTAKRFIEDIVRMAAEANQKLRFGSRKSLSKTIGETLKDNAFNRNLFRPDEMIFGGRVNTLFEARAIENVQDFTELLWERINNDLSASISQWLVITPLKRLTCNSFELGYDGISLISSTDAPRWAELATQYLLDSDWNPAIGGSAGGASLNYFIGGSNLTWLACEVYGTNESARESAARKMRTFISVMFSSLYQRDKSILIYTDARPNSDSIQFPSQSSSESFTHYMAYIGTLFPSWGNDIELSSSEIADIRGWYTDLQVLPMEIQKRCTAAAHFLNYGLVSGELERFIHFFISLDALFGVRNNVEKTITRALLDLYQTEPVWEYRASRLFDLRSTLVHGGCTSIEEWNGFESYRQHTNSEPSRDVTNAAIKALRLSPHLLHLMSPPPAVKKRGNGIVVACSIAFLAAMLLGRNTKRVGL
jgi:hypothetical protein